MTFCHNYFFFVSQFHVKYAYAVSKTVTSFMQFQKNCHQFHVQFQKKTVTFVFSGGETIRHFAKKKNTITSCEFESLQKNFFSSCKILKLLPFFFLAEFFELFFFC